MSTVQAITQATGAQFQALTERAQNLGATTRFTASQAAEGMLFLARAGFETDQVLASVQGTLLLAQAGALSLGRAADIASNVLQGFRLEAEETGRVVDVMALAANSANTNVEQLGDALKFVAPVAAGLNVSLEETTAAVGQLSNAGLQATLAGTGLRRVLAELESPGERTRAIFASLGVTVDEVRVSQVGLTAALERLRDAGIDTGLALEIFGQRGGPAFEVLSNSIEPLREMTEGLGQAEGTARRVAEIMDDNLNGALLRVASAYESVVLAFGQAGATSFLRDTLEGLAEALRTVARNMDTTIEVATRLFAVLVVAKILSLTRGFAGLSAAITAAGSAMRFALRAFVVPALIVEGILLIVDAWGAVQRTIERLDWNTVIVAGMDAVEGIINAFARLPAAIGRIIERIARVFVTAFTEIADFVGEQFSRTIEGIFGRREQAELQARLQAIQGELARVFERFSDASPDDQLLFSNRIENLTTEAERIRIELDRLVVATDVDTRSFGERLAAGLSELTLSPAEAERARANLRAIGADLGDTLGEALRERLALFTGSANELAADLAEGPARQPGGPAGVVAQAGGAAPARLSQEEIDRLRELRDAYDPVGAAQRELAEATELLDSAFQAGNITLVEAGTLTRRLNLALADQLDPLGAVQRSLDAEIRLRGVLVGERNIEIALRREEQALLAQGVELSRQERDALRQQIDDRDHTNRLLRLEADAYQSLQSPVTEYVDRMRALNTVLLDHPELAGRAVQAQEDLRLAFLDTQTTIEAGAERAFIRAGREARDFATATERAIQNMGRGIEDVFVRFAQTGKFEFSQLVDSIIADLTRLAVRQALFGGSGGGLFQGLFGALFGGGGNTAFAASSGPSLTGSALFARGGMVYGPGSGTSDSILARLSAGEFIVNARATARNLDTLRRINASVPAFQGGGFVGAPPSGGQMERGAVVQIIDQRGRGQPVEVERGGRGPDGRELLRVFVRDEVRSAIGRGDFDRANEQRYGNRPLVR